MVRKLYEVENKLEKEAEVTRDASPKTHCHEIDMAKELGKTVLLSFTAIEVIKGIWNNNKERENDYER